MFGLRQKLSLGFAGLLLVVVVIGVQGILRVNELGQSIDVILRENYRSVIACQEMKECLERVDSAVLFVLLGNEKEGRAQITEYLERFDKALRVEEKNITLPEEGKSVQALGSIYHQYRSVLDDILNSQGTFENCRTAYFGRLLPLFYEVKKTADHILDMNQRNMTEANTIAREKAARASQRMYLLLLCGGGIAVAFVVFTGRWVLNPITRLIASVNEISRGNLDLVVGNSSGDEIGQLSQAFDTMAESLREFRRSNQTKLVRIQQSMQKAFDSLPDAIAVFDVEGVVEVATNMAKTSFGLKPGGTISEVAFPWMVALVREATATGRAVALHDDAELAQVFIRGEERFFRPEAIPISDTQGQPIGVTLVLHDVTQLRAQDELKRGVLSTASHQLKTPLTSIRMALYLLLDEKLGSLTPKQEEIVMAARDDSDRLHGIVESLLDIARIQSGRVQMEMHSTSAELPVLDALESFRSAANDRGITLVSDLPKGLPEVCADPTRIPHVFANLLSNAIKYTSPGGRITVSARVDADEVWYSVSDTGCGIASEYVHRVFEQFFRVPNQREAAGAGLGLAIVKEIVEAHGGAVRVESEVGKGSTFLFSLRRSAPRMLQECAS